MKTETIKPLGFVVSLQTMTTGYCPECKATTELVDDNGENICTECGCVVSENRVVNGPEFMETAGGGFVACGTKYDGLTTPYSNSTGHGRPSREITVTRGKRLIEDIVANMNMPPTVVKAALRLYALAVSGNFARGRKTINVVSSCIYASCRTNKPNPCMSYSIISGILFLINFI